MGRISVRGKGRGKKKGGMPWVAGASACTVVAFVLLWMYLRSNRAKISQGKRQLRVAFVHPDLGIGGAERLVVDAAVGLQSRGHSVVMYTSHHDPNHAFEETRDGTLKVKVRGDFLPRSVFGRLHILFASLRGIYLAVEMLLFEPRFDVLVVDQLSIPMPFLKMTGSKMVFYCHFPDLKLSGKRGFLKSIYRIPFDFIEEKTTLMADCILVNSKFTAEVFRDTFRSSQVSPVVLYPSINLSAYDVPPPDAMRQSEFYKSMCQHTTFVSINRFERKKDVGKAVRAFALLATQLEAVEFKSLRLILAGGYDPRVAENVEYKEELEDLAAGLGVKDQVIFKPSFSGEERSAMLEKGLCIVYTPANEHFGIVPVEGMYAGLPVVACNSGGPMESIMHGKTGLLCEDTPESFSKAMLRLVRDRKRAEEMGAEGRRRVLELFSLSSFSLRLDATIRDIVKV